MSAGTIPIYQNVNQSLTLHFTDATGADINLTGKTVYLYVARGTNTANLITKSISSHSDPTHGRTNVSLTAAETALDARSYVYEIWLDNTPSEAGRLILKDTLRV